jgi:hypothetical protein
MSDILMLSKSITVQKYRIPRLPSEKFTKITYQNMIELPENKIKDQSLKLFLIPLFPHLVLFRKEDVCFFIMNVKDLEVIQITENIPVEIHDSIENKTYKPYFNYTYQVYLICHYLDK